MTSTQKTIQELCDKAGRPDLYSSLAAGTVAQAYDKLLDVLAEAKQAKQAKAPKPTTPADMAALVGPALAARNSVKQGEATKQPARAPVQAEPAAASFDDLANRVYSARQAGKGT